MRVWRRFGKSFIEALFDFLKKKKGKTTKIKNSSMKLFSEQLIALRMNFVTIAPC